MRGLYFFHDIVARFQTGDYDNARVVGGIAPDRRAGYAADLFIRAVEFKRRAREKFARNGVGFLNYD